MIPAFCINRPVATILLAIGLVLAGLAGYRLLPVAALPKVDFPTINVTATLSGASPETMATSVSTPLIKQFETIPGISEISATNSLGNSSVVLQFDLNRDIDAAAADVQAAISRQPSVAQQHDVRSKLSQDQSSRFAGAAPGHQQR